MRQVTIDYLITWAAIVALALALWALNSYVKRGFDTPTIETRPTQISLASVGDRHDVPVWSVGTNIVVGDNWRVQ